MKTCATCGGTGRQILNRSMFIADGYRPERCGICAGTGKSNYPGVGSFVTEQARRRDVHGRPPRSNQAPLDVSDEAALWKRVEENRAIAARED